MMLWMIPMSIPFVMGIVYGESARGLLVRFVGQKRDRFRFRTGLLCGLTCERFRGRNCGAIGWSFDVDSLLYFGDAVLLLRWRPVEMILSL